MEYRIEKAYPNMTNLIDLVREFESPNDTCSSSKVGMLTLRLQSHLRLEYYYDYYDYEASEDWIF